MTITPDNWTTGEAYELFMGRWSKAVAAEFIRWLHPAAGWDWLEVGCGTGALTQAVLEHASPAFMLASDLSPQFLSFTRSTMPHPSLAFVTASAADLPLANERFDAAVSGLVLNFFPDPLAALHSMRSRLRPGRRLAAYVWDYAEGMEFLRIFWEEAVALDPPAAVLDERYRFPICRQEALVQLFRDAGLTSVDSQALHIDISFADFESYWTPFLGATGPAPSYVSSLHPQDRENLRQRLEERFAVSGGSPIRLSARAWAVCGSWER